MKTRVLIIFLFAIMSLGATTNINSMEDIRQANKGLTYLRGQEKSNTQEVKLKKYYLSKIVKEPSFFTNIEEIYDLYLTVFLQNGHPFWLENNNFIFHTSSNKKYLKKMQKIYAQKYKINLTLNKNSQFWKKKFKLKKIDINDLTKYMNKKVSFSPKQKLKKDDKIKTSTDSKIQKKNLAQIYSKKETLLIQKAINYLKKQKENTPTPIKLRKYILYKNIENPSIFQSYKPIYDLYLTCVLNSGIPKWLSDNKFIFHTGTNLNYLKKLQKNYKNKYNLELKLSKLPNYKTQEFILMPLKYTKIIDYMEKNIPIKNKNKILSVKNTANALKQNSQKKQQNTKSKHLVKHKKQKINKPKQNITKVKTILEKVNTKDLKLKHKTLEEERKKIAIEKIKLQKERKLLETQKKALNEEKLAISAQKEAHKKIMELKKKEAKAEESRIKEEHKKKLKQEAEKKKKIDALTSDIDIMLKETSDYKKNLERSESIKYY